MHSRPTQRAPDKWESARFTGIFLASGLYCSQTESTPAHLRVTQTVMLLNEINKENALRLSILKMREKSYEL
jgi:hypothetical protein